MLTLSTAGVVQLFLVFSRISAFTFSAPVFSHRSVPVQWRIFFSLFLAYTLTLVLPLQLPPSYTHPLGLLVAASREVLTGLLLGFAVQFIFWAVQFAGEVIGFQVGLTLAQVYDPASGTRANPLGRFLIVSLTLLFLLLDGHHQVIEGLAASFRIIPLAGGEIAASGPLLLQWIGQLFATALRLAAPFMLTILIVDASLAVFVRMVPQADLFSIALPLKLILGLTLTLFFVKIFFEYTPLLLDTLVDQLRAMIEALASL